MHFGPEGHEFIVPVLCRFQTYSQRGTFAHNCHQNVRVIIFIGAIRTQQNNQTLSNEYHQCDALESEE